MTADCTPESCTQTTVPMIFRWHSPSHCPAREICHTCAWPKRETVGLVCQTCGTDYNPH